MFGRKILVVDDEIAILEVMREIFMMKGYTVSAAESAEEALDILSKESFAVMFLDLKLPGMDGIELCKRIRKDNLGAVIYALTGYTNFYTLMDCRVAGFDDFFVKPVGVEVLIGAAEDAFEKVERWRLEVFDPA